MWFTSAQKSKQTRSLMQHEIGCYHNKIDPATKMAEWWALRVIWPPTTSTTTTKHLACNTNSKCLCWNHLCAKEQTKVNYCCEMHLKTSDEIMFISQVVIRVALHLPPRPINRTKLRQLFFVYLVVVFDGYKFSESIFCLIQLTSRYIKCKHP